MTAADHEIPGRPPTWTPTDSFNSVLPVITFVVLNTAFGLGWGIAGTTVASLYAMWSRSRRGLGIGLFIPLVAGAIIARGAIGIISDSEDVYFGLGIAFKVLTAIGLGVSVLIGKNAVGWLAPYVVAFDRQTLSHAVYRSTTAVLTLVWAGYLAATSIFDVWLLSASSANGYVVIRFLVSWPLSTVTLSIAMIWASRRLAQIPGFPGLINLLETQTDPNRAQ